MIRFLFKIRYSADPKGKPRVYFTCHPNDFEKHFEKITDDILKLQDCAVYYTEDMSESINEADIETSLGQMNLLVIPITQELLTTSNRAKDEDIAYAISAKIPILPLMMESGLDHIYSSLDIFKDIQYLNPYDNDPTSIKYEEKLNKYLDTVLISEELANRVRTAFDAYVFLSYRKKDRNYANKLMKTIHSIPNFYDLAIWYDEFLTPGENFKENIIQILNESMLFALVVTPNILEEKNFVLQVEYPMAENADMKILPVEMVKTDRIALAQNFNNLPSCIDPDNLNYLNERMLDALMRVATTENDKDPEHNYLIGLAYLEGIDVEVNRERGIELITLAADRGLGEAMEKLYRLYSGEDGNAFVSNSKAQKWGEKVVEYKEKVFGREHPNTLTAMAKLAATYSALRKYEKAAGLLEEVYQIRCKVLGETNEVTLISLHNLAVEYTNLKEIRKALELNEKVYALRCKTIGETHPDTIITLHNIANAYLSLKDVQTAVVLFEKSYRQSKAVLSEEHPNTLHILRSLAQTYQKVGEYQKAIDLLEKALTVQSKVHGYESKEVIYAFRDLSYAYYLLGDLTKFFDCIDNAIKLCCKIYGPKSSYTKYMFSQLDNCAYEILSKGDYNDSAFNEAMLFWIKAYDYRYYYLGLLDDETDSTLYSLVDNISSVSDPNKIEEILKRIYEAIMKLRDLIYFGSYKGTTKEGFTKMHDLLEVYREYGTIEKRVELWETFFRLCVAVFGEGSKAAVKFGKVLEEEKALLD